MLNTEIQDKLERLKNKYSTLGQDSNAYLDGLIMSNVTNYWDYINTNVLLNLQQPKTDFPDELVFIVYHQITELYFKLVLHEIEQIQCNGILMSPDGQNKGGKKTLEGSYFKERITRINRYFEALTKSFEIMINGMDKEQFLKFRMALLPASGFQSFQYRKIEILCTDFCRIVQMEQRHKFESLPLTDDNIKKMFEYAYWKRGAIETETGKKTLTLKTFEKKYGKALLQCAIENKNQTLWTKYLTLPKKAQKDKGIIEALRWLDINVNVNWPLVHYKSAARYLERTSSDVAATGGTNWQKYLPPRFQKRIFFPSLWTKEELNNWGKSWVESVMEEKKL